MKTLSPMKISSFLLLTTALFLGGCTFLSSDDGHTDHDHHDSKTSTEESQTPMTIPCHQMPNGEWMGDCEEETPTPSSIVKDNTETNIGSSDSIVSEDPIANSCHQMSNGDSTDGCTEEVQKSSPLPEVITSEVPKPEEDGVGDGHDEHAH